VPLLLVLAASAAVVLAAIVLMPISLLLRYRASTSRRAAHGWLAAVNLTGILVTAGLFFISAAIAGRWVPDAFSYTVTGFAAGCILGLLGLAASRWEVSPRGLYYTPNRWLVLALTLLVAGRIVYGFWRAWASWRAGLSGGSWVVVSGVAGSLAAGAVVLGYYAVYWAGVRRRVARHRRGESRRQERGWRRGSL
jgi:hypothetical protein